VVMEKEGTSADRETTVPRLLQDLALDVGVWRPNWIPNSNNEKMKWVQNIHQALQTASMIDACRIAAQNAELTREALCETRKAQQTSQKVGKAALVSAAAAIGSMVAAWVAIAR